MSDYEMAKRLRETEVLLRRTLSGLGDVWMKIRELEADIPVKGIKWDGPVFDGGIPTQTGMGDLDWDI